MFISLYNRHLHWYICLIFLRVFQYLLCKCSFTPISAMCLTFNIYTSRLWSIPWKYSNTVLMLSIVVRLSVLIIPQPSGLFFYRNLNRTAAVFLHQLLNNLAHLCSCCLINSNLRSYRWIVLPPIGTIEINLLLISYWFYRFVSYWLTDMPSYFTAFISLFNSDTLYK